MAGWEFLGFSRLEFICNWRMTIIGFEELFRDLCVVDPAEPIKEVLPYFPVGAANQDCEENFYAGMWWNGGHRMNFSAADIPSAFLRSFVKYLTTPSKKKNCKDDEAVFLFDFEEILKALQEVDGRQLDDQHSAETAQEADVVEEDEEEEDDLQLGGSSEEPSQLTQWLSSTASSKAAAPIVRKFHSKLNCTDCRSILESEGEFPLHLHHTTAAPPELVNAPLPPGCVANVVKAIYQKGMPELEKVLHQGNVVQKLHRLVARFCSESLPSV